MANYKLLIKPSAVKELETLPLKIRRQVVKRIQGLAAEPRPFGPEKLSGLEKYRLRQEDHRILYEIDVDEQSVVIVKIAHRREAYR
ncbi:MAG: type II toxin-antitoxin system RelE/ParE family toxin [Terriglobia bacterium]